jgi:hypothetical protein
VKIPIDGLTFLVEDRRMHLVSGLKIDVQELWGRRGIVAFNEESGPSSC